MAMGWMRALAAMVVLTGWASHATALEASFTPAAELSPHKGPGVSKGAIIYSHGKQNLADPVLKLPPYVERLSRAGWDVWRLVRPFTEDKEETSTERLIAAGRQLRAKGYGRVAAAGQSMGGWISVRAAMLQPDVFDTVLATAPAAWGTWYGSTGLISGTNWRANANVVEFAADMRPQTRLMAFFFANDDYDPGGRGEAMAKAMAGKNTMFAVIDRPEGLVGHGAAGTAAFDRMYGACIATFLDAPAEPGHFQCPPLDISRVATSFSLPTDLMVKPAAADAPAALTALMGQWYGFYPNGREVLVTFEEVRTDGTTLVYAWGPLRDGKAGWQRASAQWDGTMLRSADDKRVLTYRPLPDGRITAHWEKPDGSIPLDAILERLN